MLEGEKLYFLSQINLLEELPMEELQEIDKVSSMKPIKKGTLIISPTRRMETLFLLKQGQVKLYRMNEEGKQFTIDVLGNGNIFGETSSFTLHDDSIYAEAMIDTYLCLIGKQEFEELITSKPMLALKFISILSNRLKDVYEKSEHIALRDVKYRLVALLLKLSQQFGKRTKEWQSIEIKLTHHDYATMIGSTRETVSAVLTSLQKSGIIKKRIRSLYVHVEKAEAFLHIE